MPAIGQLTHRLELIAAGRVADGSGGFTRADTPIGTVWAHVRVASASEIRQGERNQQRITHVAQIRWRRDFVGVLVQGSRCRWIDYGGQVRELRIETVLDPDLKSEWFEMHCLEGGAK